ncbi:MAG: UDP-3-O-acyl-N-acetylglucosamine deacetylase [Fusobacteriaceae bacterium]|nr:UDP-3-O-acyl-N-acetylglucosamine deacetylase [Fusobacteriaceae bacterium]
MKRKTIVNEIGYEGIGLHKGQQIKIKLKPYDGGNIVFKRMDMEDGKNEIILDISNTFDLTRGTNLQNEHGAQIYTIEHFLSSLYACGITDLMVEIDGNELPIGDGSAKVFLEIFEKTQIKELDKEIDPLVIEKPIFLRKDDKAIIALPNDDYRITYAIKFEHTYLKSQLSDFVVTYDTYRKEIGSARTFGFDFEVEYLKKNNLALGGSLENAIVIKNDGVLNPEGLRYEDEFVRHKMLDIIGDLKILNRPIIGHIIAIKAGHALDIEFAKMLNCLSIK